MRIGVERKKVAEALDELGVVWQITEYNRNILRVVIRSHEHTQACLLHRALKEKGIMYPNLLPISKDALQEGTWIAVILGAEEVDDQQ
jgi:hypothetical protein